jgi:hypothetical protein
VRVAFGITVLLNRSLTGFSGSGRATTTDATVFCLLSLALALLNRSKKGIVIASNGLLT